MKTIKQNIFQYLIKKNNLFLMQSIFTIKDNSEQINEK